MTEYTYKMGDYVTAEIPLFRRKYWLFGAWIKTGYEIRKFKVTATNIEQKGEK